MKEIRQGKLRNESILQLVGGCEERYLIEQFGPDLQIPSDDIIIKEFPMKEYN